MSNDTHPEGLEPAACPFCGDLAWLEAHAAALEFGSTGYRVECRGACHGMTCYWHTEAEAIAAWNRRASPPPADREADRKMVIEAMAHATFLRNGYHAVDWNTEDVLTETKETFKAVAAMELRHAESLPPAVRAALSRLTGGE